MKAFNKGRTFKNLTSSRLTAVDLHTRPVLYGRLGRIFQHGYQNFFEPLQGDLASSAACGFTDERVDAPMVVFDDP